MGAGVGGMKRVIIIGGNGSGKTTFAYKLAEMTGFPLIHTDAIYWKNHWESVSREEFDEIMQEELKKEEWIVDGNNIRTIPQRLELCDTVFYFDFPSLICLWGVFSRCIKNYGKSRPDMGGYCPERIDFHFYKQVLSFNRRNRKKLYAMIKEAQDVKCIVFKNRRQVKRYLRELAVR